MKKRLYILLLTTMIGCGLKAAPIVVSGDVTNNGVSAPNEWVGISADGISDTLVLTDSLGRYSCTINPIVSSGIITSVFVDCNLDSIQANTSFTLVTRNVTLDLNGCLPRPDLIAKGQVLNSNVFSGTLHVYFSLDNFLSTLDSVPIDSNGAYRHEFYSLPSQGILSARIVTCSSSFDVDSVFFRTGDSVVMNFDHCPVNPTNHRINILQNGVPVSSGEAYVLRYRFDTSIQEIVFEDTLNLTPGGMVEFPKSGQDYFLKVMPLKSNHFIPTYYPRGLTWDGPNSQVIGSHSSDSLQIDLITFAPDTLGTLSVSGGINISADIDIPGYQGVGVYLLDSNSNPVQFIFQQRFGYTFDGVRPGKYQVWIDQCGVPTESNFFELFNGIPVFGVNANVSRRRIEIRAPGTSTNEHEDSHLSIWPNPARDYINIDFKGEGRIFLFTVNGTLIRDLELKADSEIKRLDLTGFKSGIYLLRWENGQNTEVMKLLVE